MFDELHNTDREIGSSFAVYKDGEPIIDIWGGFSSKEKIKEWERNTLANVWSTTKGVAAITLAHAYENDLIDYDEKVCEYWPEFGCNGKEEITVVCFYLIKLVFVVPWQQKLKTITIKK